MKINIYRYLLKATVAGSAALFYPALPGIRCGEKETIKANTGLPMNWIKNASRHRILNLGIAIGRRSTGVMLLR